MAATIGNKFWMNRSKHGRDKIFSSPEFLLSESMEYFNWCTENPLYEVDFKGKYNEEVHIPKMRAFTWDGLELYLGVESLREYKTTYKDFSQVITYIGKIISTQKFEGAAAGLLNPNIIARDLGLRDNSDVSTNGKDIQSPIWTVAETIKNQFANKESDVTD
jgi:hypothetical protein